jgi:hypothetical protein
LAGAPVFLAGVDRSGIGLLGELLDAHPSFAISRRLNYWTFFYDRFGSLDDPRNLERCLTSLGRYRRIRDLHVPLDEVRQEFVASGDHTYGRLYALIQSYAARRSGKPRWGDKSLDSEGDADTIFREFPIARMLHVIRDPRDRFASQSRHRKAGRGGVGSGTALWLWSAHLAECNQQRYGDSYLVVRFEDLVMDTEHTLRTVCEFLGEAFCVEMIEAVAARNSTIDNMNIGARNNNIDNLDAIRHSSRSNDAEVIPKLNADGIGRHRRDLNSRQIAYIDLRAASEMARHAYRGRTDALRASDRFRLRVLDEPRWRLGAALWRVQRRRRVHAQPSSRRIA